MMPTLKEKMFKAELAVVMLKYQVMLELTINNDRTVFAFIGPEIDLPIDDLCEDFK